MELHKLNAAVILFSHHRPGEAACSKGFSHTRGPLQNEVLLILEDSYKAVIPGFAHVHIAQEIILCIGVGGLCRRYGVFLTDQVENEVVFSFGEFEQAALGILEVLHLFQFRALFQSCIINGRSESFYFFEVQLFPILFCADTGKGDNLFDGVGLVTDDQVTGFCVGLAFSHQ